MQQENDSESVPDEKVSDGESNEEKARLERLAEHDRALEQAFKDGHEVVMKFGAEWCQPCHRMDKETFGNPEVSAFLSDNTEFLKFDIEESPDLAEKYKISGLPATLIGNVSRDADGNFVFTPRERLEGFQSAEQLMKELKNK